jgi:hypothetical protein
MEESKAELDFLLRESHQKWLQNPTPDTLHQYELSKDKVANWKQTMRTKHLNMIYEKEAQGHETHRWVLAYGPKHPTSYLLYNDAGTLIFPRDQSDRYSSYTFWLAHLTDEEPVDHLGDDFFSAKELDIRPEVISEYYQLQQVFVKGYPVTERDHQRLEGLRDTIQSAFDKIDRSKMHQ